MLNPAFVQFAFGGVLDNQQHIAGQAIGIADQTGSLEPGKRADVVIWSADPFSIYARADQVFIDGALTYDRSNPAYQPTSDFELGQPGYGLTAANVTEGAR